MNIEKLLSLSLKEIESRDFFPGVVLYVNHHYPFRPKNLFNDLGPNVQNISIFFFIFKNDFLNKFLIIQYLFDYQYLKILYLEFRKKLDYFQFCTYFFLMLFL